MPSMLLFVIAVAVGLGLSNLLYYPTLRVSASLGIAGVVLVVAGLILATLDRS